MDIDSQEGVMFEDQLFRDPLCYATPLRGSECPKIQRQPDIAEEAPRKCSFFVVHYFCAQYPGDDGASIISQSLAILGVRALATAFFFDELETGWHAEEWTVVEGAGILKLIDKL